MVIIETARKILDALTGAGFEAYIVGGAVRDILLGKAAVDIDIATNALPAHIRQVAQQQGWRTVEAGAAFGVVMAVIDGSAYDVATFRTERYGEDCHKPETVGFCSSLEADLARRDFTMNALAMDTHGNIIDLFGGREDIARGVIRTVGRAGRRFAEDGLRMFRAVRFAAQLGFSPDTETMAAIKANLPRVRGLSVERVTAELEKILVAPYAAQGLDLLLTSGLAAETCRAKAGKAGTATPILTELAGLSGLEQNPRFHRFDVWGHTLATVEHIAAEPTLRWAALLHDIGKGHPGVRSINKYGQPSDCGHDQAGARMAGEILSRLRVSAAVAEQVVWLIRNHMHLPAPENKAVIRWLRKLATGFRRPAEFAEAVRQLLELHRADRLAGHTEPDLESLEAVGRLVAAIQRSIPFYPVQLAIAGHEIAAKLGQGPQVASFQHDLLARIQSGQLDNSRETLIAALDARCVRVMRNIKKTDPV